MDDMIIMLLSIIVGVLGLMVYTNYKRTQAIKKLLGSILRMLVKIFKRM